MAKGDILRFSYVIIAPEKQYVTTIRYDDAADGPFPVLVLYL